MLSRGRGAYDLFTGRRGCARPSRRICGIADGSWDATPAWWARAQAMKSARRRVRAEAQGWQRAGGPGESVVWRAVVPDDP